MKKKIFNFLSILFYICLIYSLLNTKYIKYSLAFLILATIFIYLSEKTTSNIVNIDNPDLNNLKEDNAFYKVKKFLTPSEISFYKKMQRLQDMGYIIVPQVNLATIIEKQNAKYHNELFRNVDFGLFDANFNLLLLIELNDKSHQEISRRNRDLKVRKILNDCQIKLLVFYTFYPNETDYVVNRILNAIKENTNQNMK